MNDPSMQAQMEPGSARRRKRREAVARVGWYLYLAYCRTLYRPHMRIIHHFGYHWFSVIPIDGSGWCHWCGKRRASEVEIERLRLSLREIAAMGPADEEWDENTLKDAVAVAKRALHGDKRE